MILGLSLEVAKPPKTTISAPVAWTLDDIPAQYRIGLWEAQRAVAVDGRVASIPDRWGGLAMTANARDVRPRLVAENGVSAAVWPNEANNLSLAAEADIAPAHWIIVAQYADGAAASWPKDAYPNLISTGGNGNSAFGRRVMAAASGAGWYQTNVWTGKASINARPYSDIVLPLPMSMIEMTGAPETGPWSLGLASGMAGRGWRGKIAMALALSREATGDLLARIQGRVAWDHGLQASLPADHAYRAQPPRL